MRPSGPLCDPRRLLAGLAAFVRPSPPSFGPRRLHAALASFVRPWPPLCGPRRLHATLAAFVRLSPFSCGHYRTCPASAAAGERPAVRWLMLVSSSSRASSWRRVLKRSKSTKQIYGKSPNCMGGIREFNCACLIVSRLLVSLLNTSIQFTLLVYYFLVFYSGDPLVYYKNTQPIIRSQTRENTRLHATTACKANRGVFLYSSGQQPSSVDKQQSALLTRENSANFAFLTRRRQVCDLWTSQVPL